MNFGSRALCAALLLTSAPTFAQTPTIGLAPQPPSVPSGTTVVLRTLENLTTQGKMLQPGHRFNLELTQAIKVDEQVIVPVGARAIGEVTAVRNKGMWGKSGGITARVVSMQVGDRSIRMTGSLDDRGKTGTTGVVASVAVLPLAGFFVTGTSAKIPAGTTLLAFTDEPIPLVALPAADPVAPITPASN